MRICVQTFERPIDSRQSFLNHRRDQEGGKHCLADGKGSALYSIITSAVIFYLLVHVSTDNALEYMERSLPFQTFCTCYLCC
ncbi:hypothetical protein BP00DRAFT_125831 [Aspergillus indologenus CBS 114.80]|uniref:Uncharacterized protein n=1 Tax=Aspergillus indologenus CBS 114.80 TaxID=1450541 RepID=A0A2V5I932_9EURO|nr:hypothetical protein BP00DRAFT_125831 [Aspergillus indologenus CBS 114.80]